MIAKCQRDSRSASISANVPECMLGREKKKVPSKRNYEARADPLKREVIVTCLCTDRPAKPKMLRRQGIDIHQRQAIDLCPTNYE